MTEQDMKDVIERLTEHDEDVVFVTYYFDDALAEMTRAAMLDFDTIAVEIYGGQKGVLKPFTDANGKRWTPDDLTS